MRIACLQFAPEVGETLKNQSKADAILAKANPYDLDLLVLPEMAFSGYNFKSLQHIHPFLEKTEAGVSSKWAKHAALTYNTTVTVGYPETADVSAYWPCDPEYYNSAVAFDRDGDPVAHYRKTFLYTTDEPWALEGHGFLGEEIDGLGKVAMGICMDINQYKFQAPWNAWEFANHVIECDADLVILPMAWNTREDPDHFLSEGDEPDTETLGYWVARLEPLVRLRREKEIIVVCANRCGQEGEALYAGTSAVFGIKNGEVSIYGILGRNEQELLIVDTSDPPQMRLKYENPRTGVDTDIPSASSESHANDFKGATSVKSGGLAA